MKEFTLLGVAWFILPTCLNYAFPGRSPGHLIAAQDLVVFVTLHGPLKMPVGDLFSGGGGPNVWSWWPKEKSSSALVTRKQQQSRSLGNSSSRSWCCQSCKAPADS